MLAKYFIMHWPMSYLGASAVEASGFLKAIEVYKSLGVAIQATGT